MEDMQKKHLGEWRRMQYKGGDLLKQKLDELLYVKHITREDLLLILECLELTPAAAQDIEQLYAQAKHKKRR